MVTTAILNSASRSDTEKNWFSIGQIPNIKQYIRQLKATKHSTQYIYHACLQLILNSFKQAQKQLPVIPLWLGNRIKYVKLHMPLAFVIGDGLSADQMCSRVLSHKNTNQLSRFCWQHSSTSDHHAHVCYPVDQNMINRLTMAAIGVNKNELCWTSFIDDLTTKKISTCWVQNVVRKCV